MRAASDKGENKRRMYFPRLTYTLEDYTQSTSPPSPPPSRLLVLLLLLSLLQNHSSLMVDAFRDHSGGSHQDQDVDLEETSCVEVVSGFNASLPCTIRTPPHDSPLLTLWYIGQEETPVYSYDQRTAVSGTSWADPVVFGGRAHYLAHLSPPALLIMKVGVNDAQLYRCRIDFHNSNSRVAWIRLRVIVPPERVEIIPQMSPVLPGQRDDVVCTAIGGTPSPSVVWLQDGRVVDPNSTVGQGSSYNRLEVPASSEDLVLPFTCQASNNDITPPVSAIYTRNVTCGPTRVILKASANPMVEGRSAQITCTAIGSNPPAKITWYHQGKTIQKLSVNVTRQDKETVSVLSLRPGRHHHGRQLLCRAENPSLPLASVEDIITLNVAYRPHVRIEIGWPRRQELLIEGSDLFLECFVDANPPPYKIKFFHNGIELLPNKSDGIVMNDETLAIQHVKREQSGHYHCLASNVQGDSLSKNITISVRYIPKCAKNVSMVGAVVGETTILTCMVYAYPANVNFTWTIINNARRVRPRIIDTADYTCDGLSSTLYFTPSSTKDFGVISCYATNKYGMQQQPCTFTLVPAGPPERLNNCSVLKVTHRTLAITCIPGEFIGGLAQRFLHQIRVTSTGELVFNRSSTEASLEVRSLHPGQRYMVTITAFNARGKAPPRSFHIQTLQEAKLQISLPSRPAEPNPMVWIMGMGIAVVLTLGLLLLAVWWRTHGRRPSHTLTNLDDDINKSNNTEIPTGEVTGMSDSLCVSGLMHQTIYDATGRYRGFAHLQQVEGHQSCGVIPPSTTTTTQPEKPPLQSRFSLPRKSSFFNKGLKGSTDNEGKDSKETKTSNIKEEEKGAEANSPQKSKNNEVEELNGMKKSGFLKWRWVMNHMSGSGGGENSRFLDLCRLTESKHLRDQNKKSESAL